MDYIYGHNTTSCSIFGTGVCCPNCGLPDCKCSKNVSTDIFKKLLIHVNYALWCSILNYLICLFSQEWSIFFYSLILAKVFTFIRGCCSTSTPTSRGYAALSKLQEQVCKNRADYSLRPPLPQHHSKPAALCDCVQLPSISDSSLSEERNGCLPWQWSSLRLRRTIPSPQPLGRANTTG